MTKTYAIAQHSPSNGEVSMNGERWFVVGIVWAEDANQATVFWRILGTRPYPRILATNRPDMVAIASSRYEQRPSN